MQTMTLPLSQEFEVWRCEACGVMYAVTTQFADGRRKDGATNYCPNGHSLSYSDNALEKLRRERDNLKQQIARVEDGRAAAWRAEAEATAARKKAEAQLKRTMNRAGAGVCPCCNRTFQSLSRHMKTQHPDVVPLKAKSSG